MRQAAAAVHGERVFFGLSSPAAPGSVVATRAVGPMAFVHRTPEAPMASLNSEPGVSCLSFLLSTCTMRPSFRPDFLTD